MHAKVQFEVETEFEAVKLLYDYYKLRDLISLVPANTYLRWSSYLGSGQMTQLGLMANLSSYADWSVLLMLGLLEGNQQQHRGCQQSQSSS